MTVERLMMLKSTLISLISQTSLRTWQKSKKTESTLSFKICSADQKNTLKLQPAQTQDNQANSEYKTDENLSKSKVSAVIQEKINHIKDINVLEDLRDIISDLRLHICSLFSVMQKFKLVMSNYLQNLFLFTHKLWFLKKKLELIKLSKQIYRLCKKLVLSEFFDTYTAAQAHAHSLANKLERTKQKHNCNS